MNNNFFGQRYNNFLDNQMKGNIFIDEKFSTPLYNNSKDDKESSDFVLQKMQLSLNNFLTNLKKNEMDSFPTENETESINVEKSFNFNNTILVQKNLFENYPSLNSRNEGFPRGKEKSESNLIRKSMNEADSKTKANGYFKSPFNQDRKQKGFSVFSNSMYSINSSKANRTNKMNKNFDSNNDGNISTRIKNNNDILSIRQNKNIGNNYNTYTYNANNNIKQYNNANNIISQNNKILINENSSYSSEENNNNKNNTIQDKINNTNTNNSTLNDSSLKAKKESLNSIINNIDNDYKKIVQKIKEKKANEAKLKEKENSGNINVNKDANNKNNNTKTNNISNYNSLNSSVNLNNLTEKNLQMMNNDILLNSNDKNSQKSKNRVKNVKENLFFSKTYAESNENYFSNSTILNKKRNSFADIDKKREYSKEKDNESYNENYRTSHRKYKKHIEDQIILNDESFDNKLNNYNILSNNIKKVNNNGNSEVKINKNEEDLNGLNHPKVDLYNEDNDYEKISKNQDGENELDISKSKKLDITDDAPIHRNTPDLYSEIIKTQDPPKKEWMKTFSGSYYNGMSKNNNKINEIKNINYENSNKNKSIILKDVISVTQNNFQIINTNKEKNKLLEKFMFENNSLKEKVKNNENEIQRLNTEKKNYMEYIGWDANKYQQKIQELESKLVDNKNIKGQLTILKSQKTNLYKDYSKYKDIAESLKKENDKLTKEKDDFKKQRDILNNEIKILKINNNNIGYHNNKTGFSKTISRQKLLTVQSKKSNNKLNPNKRIKRSEDKKYNTIENESKSNNLYITVNKEHSILQFTNKSNIIVNNDTFSFMGNKNENFENNIKDVISNVDIESTDINELKNKFKEIEKIILEREREKEKYKIESLNKENKDYGKKIDKSKSKKKKINVIKTEENKNSKANNANVKKYLDEINELKNNIRKLEIEKNSLKSKIENENKKNNNNNLQKQIDDLKKQVSHCNNQIKTLKSKSNEFDEFFLMTKSFIKMIKPSNDKEKDLYFKLKNHIEYLDKEVVYSENFACPYCDFSLPELEPRMFSFNAPFGACPDCKGLGVKLRMDPDLVIPDGSKSLNKGAIKTLTDDPEAIEFMELECLCNHYKIDMDKAWDKLL